MGVLPGCSWDWSKISFHSDGQGLRQTCSLNAGAFVEVSLLKVGQIGISTLEVGGKTGLR